MMPVIAGEVTFRTFGRSVPRARTMGGLQHHSSRALTTSPFARNGRRDAFVAEAQEDSRQIRVKVDPLDNHHFRKLTVAFRAWKVEPLHSEPFRILTAATACRAGVRSSRYVTFSMRIYGYLLPLHPPNALLVHVEACGRHKRRPGRNSCHPKPTAMPMANTSRSAPARTPASDVSTTGSAASTRKTRPPPKPCKT